MTDSGENLEKYLWSHLEHSFFGKVLKIFGTKKSALLFWTGTSEVLQKSFPHESVRWDIDTVKYLENKSVVLWEVSSIYQLIFQCQLLYISEIITLSFIVPSQMIME